MAALREDVLGYRDAVERARPSVSARETVAVPAFPSSA
jgi:hypothetical protein